MGGTVGQNWWVVWWLQWDGPESGARAASACEDDGVLVPHGGFVFVKGDNAASISKLCNTDEAGVIECWKDVG